MHTNYLAASHFQPLQKMKLEHFYSNGIFMFKEFKLKEVLI